MNENPNHGVGFMQSHSLPESKLNHYSAISTSGDSTSYGSGIEISSGPQFLWGSPNFKREQPNLSMWRPPPLKSMYHDFTYGRPHASVMGSSQPSSQRHLHKFESAQSGNPFEEHFNCPSFGEMIYNDKNFMGPRSSGNNCIPENSSRNFSMMSCSARPNPMLHGDGRYAGVSPINMEVPGERGRSSRPEQIAGQVDNKKQFQLDLEKILKGEDARTTLMIKNIPNKYTSKMLLAAIDENHKGTYDFLYLPIDFKNKCNVGYAFINMLFPAHIIPFYQAFDGKKWEKFNSEKVPFLAYARIQGKAALVTHFQNSSPMNVDKRCRPLLFHSEGSEATDQVVQEPLSSSSLNVQTWHSSCSDFPPKDSVG